MKRLVLLALWLTPFGCGDDDASSSDGSTADVGVADAALDGQPLDGAPLDGALLDAQPLDAAVASRVGAISIFDIRLPNMGGAGVDGRGLQVEIVYEDLAARIGPVIQEGVLEGCKVWEYTTAQLPSTLGVDEGPVQITATDGAPLMPPCAYVSGAGYRCDDPASSGRGGTLAMQASDRSTFTIAPGTPGAPTFDAADAGRYLRLASTGVGTLNGMFPIVSVVDSTSAIISGPGTNLTLPGAAIFTTVAGAGPVPLLASPPLPAPPAISPASDPMSDAEQITFAHAASSRIEAFPASTGFTAVAGIGDAFVLGTASGKVLLDAIPTDGSSFTVGCDASGSCGTASLSILDVVTTDGPVAGLSPFAMSAVVARRVHLRCLKLAATSITVPAPYSQRIARANSGATRMKATFFRANLTSAGGPSVVNPTTILGGHGQLGFVDVL